jgi:hypothetical protein
MKHVVSGILIAVSFGCTAAFAEGFRLEVAHFDSVGGALTMTANSATPLPDGCVAQLIEAAQDDGLAAPQCDGTPGVGDKLLKVTAGGKLRDAGAFATNGTRCFGTAGFFLSEPVLSGTAMPAHKIAVRVFNGSDPAQATGYWDSPLYEVIPGLQQVSFERAQWIWHARTSEGTSPALNALLASDVMAAYPNPFNSSTRLVFSLNRAQHVTLTVYDLQGRTVGRLADGMMPAGQHEFLFDASALPSGLYFMSLRTNGDLAAVRKLLLVR